MEEAEGKRLRCRICGKVWNVSSYVKDGGRGYTCPYCSYGAGKPRIIDGHRKRDLKR